LSEASVPAARAGAAHNTMKHRMTQNAEATWSMEHPQGLLVMAALPVMDFS
jgi:hypothetical protein